MTDKTILALDCGSQSFRAVVFDLVGNQLAKAQILLPDYEQAQPGWAEYNTVLFWKVLCQACHKIWQLNPELKNQISAVTLTGQRGTIITLDENNQPLRPAILWNDKRRAKQLTPINPLWQLGFKITGVHSLIQHFQKQSEINWLYYHEHEVWQQANKLGLLSSYLTLQLTGQFKDCTAAQVGYLPFDYKQHKWVHHLDWRWQAIKVKREQLPELVFPGQSLGLISKTAAKASGIPQGLPLIAAAADKACEVLGSGCLAPHQGAISLGTSATFNVFHTKYLEHTRYIPAFPAAVPKAFNLETQVQLGFGLVSWYKKQFSTPECQEAKHLDIATESLLDKHIAKIAPGSDGLLLQPYWVPGIKTPGLEARGTILGFTDQHTRFHLYRALLEGIIYELRAGKERIAQKTKQPITEIIVSGGGAQSHIATQICADVFGLPVVKPHTYETSALGAAITAAVGIGFYSDFNEATAKMARHKQMIEPNDKNHHFYNQIYQDVYQKLYTSVKPLYLRLNKKNE